MKPFPARSTPALTLGFFLYVLLVLPAFSASTRKFNQLLESVVRIDVREVAFEAGARRYSASIGSGVILSDDGIILTNAHVVSPRAIEINVTLANLERVGARLIGWDHWTDLAVLRVDLVEVRRRSLKFEHAAFGDSNKLYPGQEVFAVGTPHGLITGISFFSAACGLRPSVPSRRGCEAGH